jgi:LPXTG-site transpeptidase (sortase) family protein
MKAWSYSHLKTQAIYAWKSQALKNLSSSGDESGETKKAGLIDKKEVKGTASLQEATESAAANFSPYLLADSMEGILTIEDIQLESPILYGDSPENLNQGICRIYGSVAPGELGNCILAGHKSRVYGRHFNRLKELTVGSLVKVATRSQEYIYRVIETFPAKAEDDWILDDDFSQRQLTLITCDYSQNPIGRWIAKCVLVDA